MLLNPQYYLFATVVTLLLYWAVPSRLCVVRGWLLVILSMLIIAGVSLTAMLCGVVAAAIAWLASIALDRLRRQWIVWLALLAIAAIFLLPNFRIDVSIGNELLATIGIGFLCLKSISVVLDSWRLQQRYRLVDVLVLNLFFPIFSAGPIEQIATVNSDRLKVSFDPDQFVEGLMRVLIGVLKYYFVAAVVLDGFTSEVRYFDGVESLSSAAMFVVCIFRWLSLYFLFSGYTDIAVGVSRLFGLNVRENFDHPFLADSIQNYWQRWHISLMNFMSQYVYLAFVRRTGMRMLGIGLVFICAALWHDISLNYLIWGVLHASAMMACYLYRRKVTQLPSLSKFRGSFLYSGIVRLVTLSFVIIVSAIGTAQTFDETRWILRSLFSFF